MYEKDFVERDKIDLDNVYVSKVINLSLWLKDTFGQKLKAAPTA